MDIKEFKEYCKTVTREEFLNNSYGAVQYEYEVECPSDVDLVNNCNGGCMECWYNATKDIKFKNDNLVEFKNIDLTNVSIEEQRNKVIEEDAEFWESLLQGDNEHMKEEFCDTVQARLGILQKLGIEAEEVMEYWGNHLAKLENRPR